MTKTVAIILMSLIALCFLGSFLFLFVGFPIWAIVDCANSKQKNNGSKALWIILMFLTSTIGVLIYSFFSSESKALRRASVYVGALVAIGVIGIFSLANFYSAEVNRGIGQSIAELRTVDTSDLKPEEVQVLEKDLMALSGESKFNFARRDEMEITNSLLQYFSLISHDKKISQLEYQDWSQKFEMRRTFKSDEFKLFVRKQKMIGSLPSVPIDNDVGK